jgi:hypothetical protein
METITASEEKTETPRRSYQENVAKEFTMLNQSLLKRMVVETKRR